MAADMRDKAAADDGKGGKLVAGFKFPIASIRMTLFVAFHLSSLL